MSQAESHMSQPVVPVVDAASNGNLIAQVVHGKLKVVLGSFTGVVDPSPNNLFGNANMLGGSLPHLPQKGFFTITFSVIDCELRIKTPDGHLVDTWYGVGNQTGLKGTYEGYWSRIVAA